jgi:hypothetical protein
MKKTLIFHLFVDDIENIAYKLHLTCLRYYIEIFDNLKFIITVNDKKDINIINYIIGEILKITNGKNVDFKIRENNSLCECQTFYDEVLKNCENEMVFMAHSKGTNNFKDVRVNAQSIFMWVCGLYFYGLNFMDEVMMYLLSKKAYPECMYGPFLMENDVDDSRKFLVKYHYSGNFYWINTKYYRNLNRRGICGDVELDNPMFAEMFPGIYFNAEAGGGLSTHNNFILEMSKYDGCFYNADLNKWKEITNKIGDSEEFFNFCEKIANEIGYTDINF